MVAGLEDRVIDLGLNVLDIESTAIYIVQISINKESNDIGEFVRAEEPC